MSKLRPVVTALLVAATSAPLVAQSASPQFDVVSIKRNAAGGLGSNVTQRPDGGFTMLNIPLGTLIGRAYAPAVPADMVGLPDWVMRERYDVSATSSLARPTQDEQTTMLRAMLSERLKLAAHVENREQPVYDLVLARNDGQLGPDIKLSAVDCAAIAAAQRKAADGARAAGTVPPRPPLPDMNGPIPPCIFRMSGNRMEASATTMEAFVFLLRQAAGRYVVDKTGLTGSYQVSLTFDRIAGLRGPDVTASPDAAPSVFTAVQEQLGLKLESSRTLRETLVIDHIERPSEN
jgi:uncharacterized protein (TIGR03435 family)